MADTSRTPVSAKYLLGCEPADTSTRVCNLFVLCLPTARQREISVSSGGYRIFASWEPALEISQPICYLKRLEMGEAQQVPGALH
jgi:hypothetical protein